MSAITNMPENT